MYGYRTQDGQVAESGYSLLRRTPSTAMQTVIDNLMTLPVKSQVLNLGCGDGSLEYHTPNNRQFSFVSIDRESEAVETLEEVFREEGHGEDAALVGDITNLQALPAITEEAFAVAVSWRVLHGINPDCYVNIFQNVRDALKPNGTFFISVACDQDWKAAALGENYDADGVNDCSGAMFRDYGINRDTPFLVHFFTEQFLQELGEKNGFKLEEISTFTEPSGYEHLKDKQNTYLFAKFVVC